MTLEVTPPDAQVFTRGLLRKGPPFVFEVRRGARLVVEVVRSGYVARRVVLDGSKSEMTVGLMRKKAAATSRAKGAARAAEGSEERGAVVQSGL